MKQRDTPTYISGVQTWEPLKCAPFRKRAEYCFESTVSEKRTHRASLNFGANSLSSAKNSVSSFWHTNKRAERNSLSSLAGTRESKTTH